MKKHSREPNIWLEERWRELKEESLRDRSQTESNNDALSWGFDDEGETRTDEGEVYV